MTKVNGQVQKNGGNVVSYFLTPEGRVINAVVGPVKADKLLSEAAWAVDNFQKATQAAPKNPLLQAQMIAQAHESVGGDRTHLLLAENPLVPLPMIQQRVFEKLAGQKASQGRTLIELAAAGYKKAEQRGMPVLLVLTKPQPKPGEWDTAAAQLLVSFGARPVAQALRNCVLVMLPIDELPALTNLVKLSDLDLAERQTPTMVLTECSGKQLAALPSHGEPRDMAQQLWIAVNRARLNKVDKLIAAGKAREAITVLKIVKASPQAGPFKEEAIERLAELPAAPKPRVAKHTPPPVSDSVRSRE